MNGFSSIVAEAASSARHDEFNTDHQVAVITSIHESALPFLSAAAASLLAQSVPIHWLVCFDGDEVPERVGARIRTLCEPHVARFELFASGRKAGVATARTVALERVSSPWLVTLDADDMWLPGGIDDLLRVVATQRVDWCAGLSLDLVDGREVKHPDHMPTGYVSPGAIYEAYVRLGFLPFHGGAVLWRTSVLLRMGGWPALPAGEDSALVLAASETHHGYYVGERPVYANRNHVGQLTSHPRYEVRRAIAVAYHHRRISAMRGQTFETETAAQRRNQRLC